MNRLKLGSIHNSPILNRTLFLLTVCLIYWVSAANSLNRERVGFVDLQKALNQSDAGKIAKETFNRKVDELQKSLDEKDISLKKLKEEVKKLPASDERNEKEKLYQQKIAEAKKFAKDSQDELQKLESDYTKKILRGLKGVYVNLLKDEGYAFILEGQSVEEIKKKVEKKTDDELWKDADILSMAGSVKVVDIRGISYQSVEDLTLKTIKYFNKSNDSKELIETFYIESPSPTTQYAEKPILPANSSPIISSAPIKSDVDDLPSNKATVNKNAYAIVVGIEQYRQKLPKADFATHDAETVSEYLTKVMGYPEENVVTLLNDRASKSDFEKYFGKWLSNNVEKGGSVFVYYSGHGAPNPKTGDAYLVPYDGDPAFIDETGYSLKKLYEQLGKLEAKEIVVALDSCFSGAGGRSVLAKGARPLVMNMNTSVIPPKVAVLSASSGEQISSTYDEKGHGLFTYFMLKGLKGEAETNGSVEIGNLFEYIKPQVERIARKSYNNEQTPQLIAPKELTRMKLR